MKHKILIIRSLASLVLVATLLPWGAVFFLPNEAFAQVGSIRGGATVPAGQVGGALRNQAAQQGGVVSWSQAAASGAVSIGACLAAGGISIGAGISSVLGSLGIGSIFGGGGPSFSSAGALPGSPPVYTGGIPGVPAGDPLLSGGSALGIAPTGAGGAVPGLEVPVNDAKVRSNTDEIKSLTAKLLAIQTNQLIQISALNGKESVLDCVGWALAKMIWRSLAASIVDWINTGFNGRPMFIQDFQRFFMGIADQAIGNIIESDQYLAFLCSPFQFTIRIALAMRFAQRAPTCTLTEIVTNIENFARSFQSGGGWPAWLQFSVVPVNNPYGAYLTAEAVVSFTYQTKLGTEKFERSISSGFLSQKKQINCAPGQKPGEGTCREIIVTPGELIAQQTAKITQGGETQLLLADEFNEIIDALVGQLLSKALGSLFGLSQPTAYQDDYYRGSSFTDDLSGYTDDIGGDDGTLIGEISQSIALEQEMQLINRQAIQLIEQTQQQFGQAAACWYSKAAGTSTPPLADTNDRSQAGIQARTIDFSIATFDRRKQPYLNDILQGDRNIAFLEALIARASSAITQEEIDAVLRELNGTRSLSDFTQLTDITRVDGEISALRLELSSYDAQVTQELTRCQYFPQDPPNIFQSLFPAETPPPTQ